jgi:hypothetical protein
MNRGRFTCISSPPPLVDEMPHRVAEKKQNGLESQEEDWS